MAHYVVLDEANVVIDGFVGVDEDPEFDWEAHYTVQAGATVKRTSYNTRQGAHLYGGVPFRGNFAGIGYTYDEVLDAFIPPKPSDDAVFDEATFSWIVAE
jgi:hypothetical protein